MGDALSHLVATRSVRLGADELFQLEVDWQAWSDTKACLDEGLSARTTLHSGWMQLTGWWMN